MLHALCPVCKKPLYKSENSAVCKDGHSFDFAKEGYLNLLLPHERHSKDPGDNKEMVLARKKFLDKENYKPLADAVAQIICERYANKSIALIDAGMGTGYYLNKVISSRAHASAQNNIKYHDVYIGADISKHAVRYAAKLNPSAECAVASVFDMPYPDRFADVVTCIFAPYAMTEYKKLLKKDGILIVASPAKNHLIELRRALYDDVREVANLPSKEYFDIEESKVLEYGFTLTGGEDIKNLLAMTPYAYRAPKDKIEKLTNCAGIALTANFNVSVMRPTE